MTAGLEIDPKSQEVKAIKIKITAEEYVELLIKSAESFENGCLMPETRTVKWRGMTYDIYRFIFAVIKGEIPAHGLVTHSCDNNPCINPDHLELGTHSSNSRDSKKRGPSSFLKEYNQNRYGL